MRGLLPILSMHGIFFSFFLFLFFLAEKALGEWWGENGKGGRGLWMDG